MCLSVSVSVISSRCVIELHVTGLGGAEWFSADGFQYKKTDSASCGELTCLNPVCSLLNF